MRVPQSVSQVFAMASALATGFGRGGSGRPVARGPSLVLHVGSPRAGGCPSCRLAEFLGCGLGGVRAVGVGADRYARTEGADVSGTRWRPGVVSPGWMGDLSGRHQLLYPEYWAPGPGARRDGLCPCRTHMDYGIDQQWVDRVGVSAQAPLSRCIGVA